MRKTLALSLFFLGLLLSTGCVNVNVSLPVTTPPVTTTAADPVTPAVLPVAADPTPEMPVLAPTITAECQAIVDAAAQDKEYADAIKKYAVVSGAYAFTGTCNVAQATELNQIISNHTKPKTPLLLSARSSLVSAISQCIGPKTSATGTRVRDDLKTYEDLMEDYDDAARPCKDYLSDDQRLSLLGVDESTETDGGWLFNGTDGDMQTFQVDNAGMYIISYRCSGTSQIFINVKNDRDFLMKKIESAEGQKTGKDTVILAPGKYYLKVDTVGAWSVTVKPE